MQAPVISQSQRKKILKKKKNVKKSIRNVLSKPKVLQWPLISEQDSIGLMKQLKDCLHYNRCEKIKWDVIKDIPKDKRAEMRKKLINEAQRNCEKPISLKYVIFGVNAVTRALEQKIITSVLITSDINPPEIARHIWFSCNVNSLPIIVVPSLRTIIKECLGHATMVLGLKKIPIDNPLNEVYDLIKKLDKKFTGRIYPVTETINLNDTLIEPINKVKIENNNKENHITILDETAIEVVDDVYLYRTSTARCFNPPKSKNIVDDLDWGPYFISFSDQPEKVASKSKVNKNTKIKRKSKLKRQKSNVMTICDSPKVASTSKCIDGVKASNDKTLQGISKLNSISPSKQLDSINMESPVSMEISPTSVEKSPVSMEISPADIYPFDIISRNSPKKTRNQNPDEPQSVLNVEFEDAQQTNSNSTTVNDEITSLLKLICDDGSNSHSEFTTTNNMLIGEIQRTLSNTISFDTVLKSNPEHTDNRDSRNLAKKMLKGNKTKKNDVKKMSNKDKKNSNEFNIDCKKSYLPLKIKRLQSNPNRVKGK